MMPLTISFATFTRLSVRPAAFLAASRRSESAALRVENPVRDPRSRKRSDSSSDAVTSRDERVAPDEAENHDDASDGWDPPQNPDQQPHDHSDLQQFSLV